MSPLDTQYWEQGCLPLPTLLSRFTASLYRTIFKIEAKHNIHQTGTHTHAHRRLPRTAVRQLHSKSTKECILPPPSKKGRACAPWSSRRILPTIALLAARGRELAGSTAVCRGKEAGTGEGSANLTSDCGVKEATVGIPEGNDQGEAQASRSRGTELDLDP